jgi:hypothetical protein
MNTRNMEPLVDMEKTSGERAMSDYYAPDSREQGTWIDVAQNKGKCRPQRMKVRGREGKSLTNPTETRKVRNWQHAKGQTTGTPRKYRNGIEVD